MQLGHGCSTLYMNIVVNDLYCLVDCPPVCPTESCVILLSVTLKERLVEVFGFFTECCWQSLCGCQHNNPLSVTGQVLVSEIQEPTRLSYGCHSEAEQSRARKSPGSKYF